ncbi:hypothetical protein BH09PAT2_BH09PAT2_02240 [soil metagenome]
MTTENLIADKNYWSTVNQRTNQTDNSPNLIVRGMLHQESLWGSRGGAAVATDAMIQIMQDQLGMVVACNTLTPDDPTAITHKSYGVDLMARPEKNGKPIKNNEDLAEEMLQNPEYMQYMMLLMNGSDATFANYWLAGVVAVRAREQMEELQRTNTPLMTDNEGNSTYIHKIPKIIFCNHSLPARIDEELSKKAAQTNGNGHKQMDQRRADFQFEVYDKADAVVVWTDTEKEEAAEKYPDIPNLENKTHKVTIPVFFDRETAQQMKAQKRQEYFKNSITDETTVFYFQGRLVDYKHPEIVLDSFIQTYNTLLEENGIEPDIACLIAGDGPLHQILLDKVKTLPEDMQKRITLPGRVEQYDGHAAGDILIFPSEKESFGLTGVEAAITGNAVIANNIGTIAEANGPGGIYASTPQEYTDAMLRLIFDPSERACRTQQLQEYTTRYSADTTATDLQTMIVNMGLAPDTNA